jgi:hypothetical protein
MAQAHLHPAFDGISGRSGALVFRHVRGKTVIATRPERRVRESSAAQEAQRERFARARWYAKQVLADPWQREAYELLAKQHNRRTDSVGRQ